MIANIVLFFLSFGLFVPKFNALSSITSVIALLLILYVYRCDLIKEIKEIPKELKYGFGMFLWSLLFASLCINDKECISKAFNYIYYTIPLLLMYFVGKIASNKRCVLLAFIIGVAWTAGYGLYDFFLFNRKRLTGLYNSNATGSMLAIMLPLTICYFSEYVRKNKNRNILWYSVSSLSIILGVVALYLTGSRGAVLGCIIGFIFSGILYALKNYNGKKVLSILFVVAIVSGWALYGLYSLNGNKFSRSYDNERLLLIESSYNMWNDNKIFGIGLTNWKEKYQKEYILPAAKEPKLATPHNVVMFYFSTTGLIGGLGYIIFSLLILKYLFINLVPISSNGLYGLAILWAFFAISLHGLVDVAITKKEIYRLLCGGLGLSAAIIEYYKSKIFK